MWRAEGIPCAPPPVCLPYCYHLWRARPALKQLKMWTMIHLVILVSAALLCHERVFAQDAELLNTATGKRNFRLRSPNRPIPLCRQSLLTSFRPGRPQTLLRLCPSTPLFQSRYLTIR